MNPFDGTVHNPDGSRQFPDKEVVGGVNNYASIRSHRSSRAQMDSFENELEDNSSQNEKDEEIKVPESDSLKNFLSKSAQDNQNESSVTLLKKLVNTAPAIGNVQDRLERINELKPTLKSSIDDTKQIIQEQEAQSEAKETAEAIKNIVKKASD